MNFINKMKRSEIKGFVPYLLSNIVPLITLAMLGVVFLSVTFYQNNILTENTKQQVVQRIDEILLELKKCDNNVVSVLDEDLFNEKTDVSAYWREPRFEGVRNFFNELENQSGYIDDCFIYAPDTDSVMSSHGFHTSEEFYESFVAGSGTEKDFYKELLESDSKAAINTHGKTPYVYFKTFYDDVKIYYAVNKEKLRPESLKELHNEKLNIYIFNTNNKLSFALNSQTSHDIKNISDLNKEKNGIVYIYSTQVFNSVYKIGVFLQKGILNYILIWLIVGALVLFLGNLMFSFWNLRRLANKNYKPMININRLLSANQISYEYNLIEESIKNLIDSNESLKNNALAQEQSVKEFLLYQLLQSEFSDKMEFLLDKYNINFRYNNYYVIIFSPRGVLKASKSEEKFYSLLIDELKIVFDEEIFYSIYNDDSLIFLVNTPQAEIQKQHERITQIAYSLNLMKSRMLFDVVIGVSDVQKGYKGINMAYIEALQCVCHETDNINSIQIYRYCDIKENSEIFDLNFEQNIYEYILAEDLEKAENEIENIFKKTTLSSKRKRNEVYFRLTLNLIRAVSKLDKDSSKTDEFYNALMVYFIDSDTEEYKRKVYSSIQSIIKNREENSKKDFSNEIIEAAIKYIHANYSDYNVSLSSICEYLGYSVSYISTMFKKKMGIGIMDYLQNYRVECAKKMILDGMQIAQVCEKCGFSSLRSFTRIFKKVTGKTATEYKVQEKATEWDE